MIALNAAEMPSIDFPVMIPVPVVRMKKPIAVIAVPRTISPKGFFCKIRPIIAIRAMKIAPCPKMSLTMKLSTAIATHPFPQNHQ
jgi:hypothetical protein